MGGGEGAELILPTFTDKIGQLFFWGQSWYNLLKIVNKEEYFIIIGV